MAQVDSKEESKDDAGSSPPPHPLAKPHSDIDEFLTRTQLLEYINGAKRSALPPRIVYLLIILASASAFFAYWNSRPGSWVNQRIHSLREAQKWLNQNRGSEPTEMDAVTAAAAQRVVDQISNDVEDPQDTLERMISSN